MLHGNKTAVVFVLTLLLTPFWLMLAYIQWEYVDIDLSLALSRFQKWPWIKASFVMTSFTYLYAYYAHYQYVRRQVKITESASVYSCGLIWIFFFIFYPGSDVLGGSDDGSWFWMIGLIVTHYFSVKRFAVDLNNNE